MSYRENLARYYIQAERLGVYYSDANALRREAERLHTWAEHECNGTIQRMDEDGTFTSLRGKVKPLKAGKVYRAWNIDGPGPIQYSPTADRETGALRRVREIAERHGLTVEVQGDPRGWPLTLTKDGQSLCPPCR